MSESLDESHKLYKGLIFWVCNFYEFIFLGLIFPGIYFLGSPKNAWAEPPCHVHIRVHSPGLICYFSWNGRIHVNKRLKNVVNTRLLTVAELLLFCSI